MKNYLLSLGAAAGIVLLQLTSQAVEMASRFCPMAGGNIASGLSGTKQPNSKNSSDAAAGRKLFLKNCAHCHGIDAGGDEGPDLHKLDWTVEQIAARIRNGKKGQMTSFAGKLQSNEIASIIAYIRTLK